MRYNFARPPQTLTKAAGGYPTTPGMAAGVARFGTLMKHAQGPVGLARRHPYAGLPAKWVPLGVQPGRPPGHCLVQERLTIHMHEALYSQETRAHQAESDLGARVRHSTR
jgi:hypothetical protein